MNYLNSCYHGNQNIIQTAISQKMAYSTKKGIFDAIYLLPEGQNTNNFQHILHNLYLLYKHTNDSFKDSR